MIKPDESFSRELEEQRPKTPTGLLSIDERNRLIERGLLGLYRWYLRASQEKRNWNPDTSFDWRNLRTDHSPAIKRVIEGFFAVEQYVPDYVHTLVEMTRRSHGRSHFQIRWGSEEEKHADMWYNALLFLKHRSPNWVRDYMQSLRSKEWALLYDDPIRVTAYVVIQERATQLNYLNTGLVASGQNPDYPGDEDPVLAQAARTIAIDEAAHYNFFLEALRLYLYYFPARTLEAINHVIKNFAMPADDYIPDFQSFADALVETSIYGPRDYAKDVLQIVLDNLGIEGRRALSKGIKKTREVPTEDNVMRTTAFFDFFDYKAVENGVKRLFGRIGKYEKEIGFWDLDPTHFAASGYATE